jgi:hypothetical protein
MIGNAKELILLNQNNYYNVNSVVNSELAYICPDGITVMLERMNP